MNAVLQRFVYVRILLCYLKSVVCILRSLQTYQPVREHYIILTNQLLVDPLLPYLKHQNWLTLQEYDMLAGMGADYKQKMEWIVKFLHQKNGRVVCDEVFVKCIIWSGQIDLARMLGCNEHFIQQVVHCHPFPAQHPPFPVPRTTWPVDKPYGMLFIHMNA